MAASSTASSTTDRTHANTRVERSSLRSTVSSTQNPCPRELPDRSNLLQGWNPGSSRGCGTTPGKPSSQRKLGPSCSLHREGQRSELRSTSGLNVAKDRDARRPSESWDLRCPSLRTPTDSHRTPAQSESKKNPGFRRDDGISVAVQHSGASSALRGMVRGGRVSSRTVARKGATCSRYRWWRRR